MIRPPKRLIGNGALEQWLNQLLRFVESRQVISSPSNSVEESSRGISLRSKGGGGSSSPISIQAYHFKQSFGDYFLTQEGTSIAKCPRLRNSIGQQTIYGTIVNFFYPHNVANDNLYGLYRIASVPNVGTTENEGVTPQFLVNDLIYAIQMTTGVVSESADTSQPVGTPIGWLDLNLDGRAWTRFSNPAF